MSKKLLKIAGVGIGVLGIAIAARQIRKKIMKSFSLRRIYSPDSTTNPWKPVEMRDPEKVVHVVRITDTPPTLSSWKIDDEAIDSSNQIKGEIEDNETDEQVQSFSIPINENDEDG